MAVFGLHIGKLFKWALPPAVMSLAALGAAFALGLWLQPPGGADTRFPYWWMGFVPAGLFFLIAWVPYSIRVNQLAVTGGVTPGGYLEKIFSPASFRYLGYAVLVSFIQVAGMVVSALPVLLTGSVFAKNPASAKFLLACAVTLVLMVAFFILTSPLHLIYPAASLEREPSLAKAYTLGAHSKLRIFLCVALTAILFALLGQAVELAPKAIGLGNSQFVKAAFVPVQIFLTFFSWVTSTAVPAVAYRVLSALPNPQAQADSGGMQAGAESLAAREAGTSGGKDRGPGAPSGMD